MVKFKLSTPVTFGEETFSELTLRRPSGRDVREVFDAHEGEWARVVHLAARLSSRAPSEIDALDGADLMGLREKIDAFLSGSKDPEKKA